MYVIKTDDPNDYSACGVEPNDLLTYSIRFNPSDEERNYVSVIDYLPPEAEFVSADPNTGSHDILNHLYRWNFLTTPLDTDDKFTLTVRVTEAARPYGTITNMVEVQLLIHPEYYYWDTHTTDVCCWGGPILYVDENANNNGYETGQSWQHAFTDLQDALQLARDCSDNFQEIWVAEGTYSPGVTFKLVDGVALYGGFAGTETSRDQRNWITNQTVLTGYGNCTAVVTANEINSAVLDGFVIEAASQYGVQCTNSFLHIANCFVHHNGDYGIHCDTSDPNISYCTASYNLHGIYCDDANPTITNCLLERNGNGSGIWVASGVVEK